jgi:hypothetical protein
LKEIDASLLDARGYDDESLSTALMGIATGTKSITAVGSVGLLQSLGKVADESDDIRAEECNHK